MEAKIGKMFRLVLRFYRRFCLISLAISLFIVMKSVAHGVAEIIFAFWIKVMTTVIIGGFVYYTYQPEFQYYKNLGIGKRMLLITTISLDLLIYILMSVVVSGLYD